jgi:hypothetical protein
MQQQHLHQPSAAASTPQHTLEQQLLQQWDAVAATYYAAFIHHLPSAEELLTSLSPSMPEITLLANQSAIAAIPAALNQATSALLRMMLAARTAAGSEQQLAAEAAQAGGSCSSSDTAGSGRTNNATGTSTDQACSAVSDSAASTATRQQDPAAAAAGEPATGGPGSVDVTSLPSSCRISATCQPLPLIPGEAFFKLGQELSVLSFTMCASIALSLLAASFAPFLVRCAAVG